MNIPILALSVPRGFEDIASEDILRYLPIKRDSLAISCAADSGYVHVQAFVSADLRTCLEVYYRGLLWSVTRCILVLGNALQSLPSGLHASLETERKALPSKRSRTKPPACAHGEARKRSKNRRKIAPLNMAAVPSEVLLLECLTNAVQARQEALSVAFDVWKDVAHGAKESQAEARVQLPLSYAVTFDRRELLLPTLKSQDISRILGDEFGNLLLAMTDRETIPVDLEKPDLEVYINDIQAEISALK